jgi:predicted lipase
MPLELHEDAFGDWRNAQFLAVASTLAYEPEATGRPHFQEQLGLDARLITVSNTEAYVGTNDDHIVLAFRGTEGPDTIDGLKDILLSDARELLIVPSGRLGTDFIAAGVGARMHQGFVSSLADIWDPVEAAVTAEMKKAERPLWITGHSLGGALALLAGWLFLRKFVNVHQIYTFGAPMIGNREALAGFDKRLKGKVFRYVDSNDPVPQLPTVSLLANDYCHCDQEMPFGSVSGSYWGSVASQAVGDLFSGGGIDVLWNLALSRVGAHSMLKYIESIKSKMG